MPSAGSRGLNRGTCLESLGQEAPNYQIISGYIHSFYSLYNEYYNTIYNFSFNFGYEHYNELLKQHLECHKKGGLTYFSELIFSIYIRQNKKGNNK